MRFIVTILLLMLGSFLFAQTPELYINEFMASNDSAYADEYGDYGDWIEIYNAGDEAVNIGGMYITDDLSSPTTWQIPDAQDTTTIPAHGYLILWADKQPEKGPLHVKIKLSSGGEQIGLFLSDGVTPVDTLTFGAQTTDVSEGRTPDTGADWQNFTKDQITPGAPNGAANLIINEFMASNDSAYADEYGDYGDWIEIYNSGDFAVNVGGLYITDDLADPGAWQIPYAQDTTSVAGGGFIILWADKEPEKGPLHVKIKLSSGGEQIGLSWKTDTVFTWIDSLTFGPQATDTSEGRLPDGSDTWVNFSTSSPGETNANGVAVSIEYRPEPIVREYSLAQNYPNPFNPQTTIEFTVKEAGRVTLTVYNAIGQKVQVLLDKELKPGKGKIVWNASSMASGLYYYKLSTPNFTSVKKMLLIK